MTLRKPSVDYNSKLNNILIMLLSPTFTKCFKISVGRKLTSNNVEQTSVKSISPERQSARMSKITNDSLTRSGTGCTHMATAGVKGLIKFN